MTSSCSTPLPESQWPSGRRARICRHAAEHRGQLLSHAAIALGLEKVAIHIPNGEQHMDQFRHGTLRTC